MNKKEVLEIRKQFSPENCAISRIVGCYVDGEKNIVLEHKDAFGSLPEEESFKYFDIFKHTLSGTVGKNLLNLEFPLDSELEGGTQQLLLKLRSSHLEDDLLIEEFCQKIIEHYVYDMNYYIILIHGMYDIPGRGSDRLEMFDASDHVYDFILCSICPVNLSKAGLSYNTERNSIEDRIRDWVVQSPTNGFLFPAFNDRDTDIHSTLYYTKNPEKLHEEVIEQILGCNPPMTVSDQKESFHSMLSSALGEICDYQVVKNLHENLHEMVEVNKDNPEPLTLSNTDVRHVLEESGVPDENIQKFDEEFSSSVTKDSPILVSNVVNMRQFQIETGDVVVKVKPDRMDLIETREVDGRHFLMIPIEDPILVNGVSVKPGSPISSLQENDKKL